VIRKMGDAGVRNATFGAGATPEMQRVENIGGFRVRTLEKAYNGISHTFNLGNKGDFRSKFGSHQEPVSLPNLLLCIGVSNFSVVHLLPQGPAWRQGCAGYHDNASEREMMNERNVWTVDVDQCLGIRCRPRYHVTSTISCNTLHTVGFQHDEDL
jgi:hypothetical protein